MAVGGATYTAWDRINLPAIASFVKTFGLDGVDLDYEPASAGCTWSGPAGVRCATDAEFISLVNRTRAALPRPALLTTAAWSIGAYGQGAWLNSQPQGDHTGMSVNVLKAVGDMFDVVNVVRHGWKAHDGNKLLWTATAAGCFLQHAAPAAPACPSRRRPSLLPLACLLLSSRRCRTTPATRTTPRRRTTRTAPCTRASC